MGGYVFRPTAKGLKKVTPGVTAVTPGVTYICARSNTMGDVF